MNVNALCHLLVYIDLGKTGSDQRGCHLLNVTYKHKHYIRYVTYFTSLLILTLTFQGMYDNTHYID